MPLRPHAEFAALRDPGLSSVRVLRGDVILWWSDLAHHDAHQGALPYAHHDAHQGALPYERTRDFRAVVDACMMPASLKPPWLLVEKLKAYEKLVHGGQCDDVT